MSNHALKRHDTENSLHLGAAFHNLAIANLLAEKQNDSVLNLFEESVIVKRETFGNDHPTLAVCHVIVKIICCIDCKNGTSIIPNFSFHI